MAFKCFIWLGVVALSGNLSTLGVGAGGLGVQGQAKIHSETLEWKEGWREERREGGTEEGREEGEGGPINSVSSEENKPLS